MTFSFGKVFFFLIPDLTKPEFYCAQATPSRTFSFFDKRKYPFKNPNIPPAIHKENISFQYEREIPLTYIYFSLKIL